MPPRVMSPRITLSPPSSPRVMSPRVTSSPPSSPHLVSPRVTSSPRSSPRLAPLQSRHPSLIISPIDSSPPIRIESYEPTRVIELPVIQNIHLQRRIIEQVEPVVIPRYKEKIIVKEIVVKVPVRKIVEREKVVDKIVKVPRLVHVPKTVYKVQEVPKIEVKQVVVEIPKIEKRYNFIPKIVERFEWREKMVEIPRYVDETKFVEVAKVVDVPRFCYKYLPKIKIQQIEKIRYVEKVEYHDIPVERTVFIPTPRNVYSLKERRFQHNIYRDAEIFFDAAGDTVKSLEPTEKIVDKVIPKFVPRVIDKIVEIPVEHTIEYPVPQPRETIHIVKRVTKKPVDVIKTVEVVEIVDEVVEVPRYVHVEGPRTIIRPKYIEKFHELPPIQQFVERPRRSLPAPSPSVSNSSIASRRSFQPRDLSKEAQQQQQLPLDEINRDAIGSPSITSKQDYSGVHSSPSRQANSPPPVLPKVERSTTPSAIATQARLDKQTGDDNADSYNPKKPLSEPLSTPQAVPLASTPQAPPAPFAFQGVSLPSSSPDVLKRPPSKPKQRHPHRR